MSWRGWLAFAALGVIWGVPYFFIKIAVQEVAPFVVALFRLALASAILLPIAWRRGALRGLRAHKSAIFAFAMVEFVVPFTVISFGERWISSSVTGILIAMVPMSIALIQPLFGIREALGARRLLGLVLGFVGVAALVGGGTISGRYGWLGVGCMWLATLGYAIGPIIIQRHLAGLEATGPLAASLVVATLVLLVPAAYQWPAQLPSAAAWVSMGVLGVLCTAVAMLLMFYLVRDAGPTRAALITYINPVVAALLGASILHEQLGLGGAMAFVLILTGCWLATRGKAVRPAARSAAAG